MRLERQSLKLLSEAIERLEDGFSDLPEISQGSDLDRMRNVILEVAERMQDNFPYFHPYYAGQMLKPPHPVARLAYALSLWINPNNHALDGGRASSQMEKEAVSQIAEMFGWRTYLGHLCGGGTMANMEALWVSGRLRPGKKILASEQAHFTHRRITEVLGLSFKSVACDRQARMDMKALEGMLRREEVGTVVATIGTTATGSVDPLSDIIKLQAKYGFRIHVDAAYGGYFVLADNLDTETKKAFDCLGGADSIAIDPHKHGLQPYGCGCILFKDPSVGALYKHDSPYTYFSSKELHLGEISLECSRAGASAVALWATLRFMPLSRQGEFAEGLEKSRRAAVRLFEKISSDSRFMIPFAPELDIVVWAPSEESASEISRLSRKIFSELEKEDIHLAIADLPESLLANTWPHIKWDQARVTCLRSCLMKPEHLDWVDSIWEKILGIL